MCLATAHVLLKSVQPSGLLTCPLPALIPYLSNLLIPLLSPGA